MKTNGQVGQRRVGFLSGNGRYGQSVVSGLMAGRGAEIVGITGGGGRATVSRGTM